jgi:exopolysaccharide biosynthesis polyprenyl glycosylphosphotransferase
MFGGGQNFAVAAMVSRVVEAFLITAGFLICVSYFTGQDSIFATNEMAIPLLTAFGVLIVLLMTGFYGAITVADLRVSLIRLGVDTAIGFVLAVIASGQLAKYDIVQIYPYRWQWTFGLTAVWLLFIVARRAILNVLLEKGLLTRKVVALGNDASNAKLDALSRQCRGRFVIAARIDPDAAVFDTRLAALAAKMRAPEIVVCAAGPSDLSPDATTFRWTSGISVVDFESFYERETGQVDLASLTGAWPYDVPGLRSSFLLRAAKRTFDIAVSLIAIAATAPVMVLTMIAIKLEDGGPALFRQTRVGLDGREFSLYKFRSMRIDAEDGMAPVWASENDPRITRVGSIIRKFRVDELPQFYNTLRGEMSVIGPRPERPYFVEQLESAIPCYAARHCVKPGITGWAQVSYHYGASLDDAFQKTAYDLYYVRHQSVALDLSIVARTVKVILWPRGVR